jgi:hypothetical protein
MKWRNPKAAAGAAAVVTAVALFVTGTLAWQHMASRTNEFIGTREIPPLHDDFDPGVGMKDVYVENKAERPLFVRIELAEAMNLTSNTWRPDPDDYVGHTYETTAEDCEHLNGAGAAFHDYFTWTMGGQKWYMPATDGSTVVDDTTVYDGTESGVKQTPNAVIIKIADYLALTADEKDAFLGWIYDTDAYAYWSQPLLKEEVTGLLLHGVATDASIKNTDYYYVIDVRLQAVDTGDLPMWKTGAESIDGSGTTYETATAEGLLLIDWLENRLAALTVAP